ncbi:hypothetical protein CC78DRAFT_578123 [Lojkania enalia]|uniref:Uncharacterized protein n=1 Tax=Lojkania enalia TaxID=147567 RepID=A0A9P4N8T2_9PLEO|nr:hypothetical protein CC78DRAFT_578123 [Didymosphaeria enalia]
MGELAACAAMQASRTSKLATVVEGAVAVHVQRRGKQRDAKAAKDRRLLGYYCRPSAPNSAQLGVAIFGSDGKWIYASSSSALAARNELPRTSDFEGFDIRLRLPEAFHRESYPNHIVARTLCRCSAFHCIIALCHSPCRQLSGPGCPYNGHPPPVPTRYLPPKGTLLPQSSIAVESFKFFA